MRSTFAFCLLLACSSSFAAAWRNDTGWRLDPGPDGTYQVFPDRGQPPPAGVSCTSGNCVAPGSKDLPGVRPPTKFNIGSGFSKGSIALGLAAAARISPWITAGMAAYDWLNTADMRVEPDGSISQEVGGTSLGSGTWSGISADSSSARYSSASAACSGGVQALNAQNAPYYRSFSAVVQSVGASSTSGTCFYSYTAVTKTGGADSGTTSGTISRISPTDQWCFDASGKAVVRPTGGLCPPGVYQPVTDQVASGSLSSAPISDANLARVWREVLDHGGQIEDSGPASLTGPSSVSGPTSTTTRTTPSGTAEVTTSNVTNNIVYQGNTLTITSSTVTNNVDGSTTTTTEPKTDPCSVNPESLACIKLGTPPTDAPSWDTKTVTYQADSLGMPAACPAPWTANIRGWSLSMSYEPACNVAPQVRAGVLALAAFMSLMLVLTAVRS